MSYYIAFMLDKRIYYWSESTEGLKGWSEYYFETSLRPKSYKSVLGAKRGAIAAFKKRYRLQTGHCPQSAKIVKGLSELAVTTSTESVSR